MSRPSSASNALERMARTLATIWSGRGLKALVGGTVQLSQAPKKQRSRKVLSHHKDRSVAPYCNVGRAAERTSSHMLEYLSCSNADELQGRDLMISCSQEEPCRRIHLSTSNTLRCIFARPPAQGTCDDRAIPPTYSQALYHDTVTPHFLHAVTCDVRSLNFSHHTPKYDSSSGSRPVISCRQLFPY
jgi:hypothetical protein